MRSRTAHAAKVTKVRRAAEKILLYEEDELTLDDGAANTLAANLLSIRHDFKRVYPDASDKNQDRRGNALFCDGHADYTPRKWLQDPGNAIPTPPFASGWLASDGCGAMIRTCPGSKTASKKA